MNNFSLETDLLTLDFRAMYVQWGKSSPPRSGMHASAILDKDFCAREQVLHQLYPEQGEAQEWNSWDWKKSAIFENGWRLHQRWQDVFLKCGNVVWSPVPVDDWQEFSNNKHLKMIDGQWYAPELDLTHYDSERNLYFSPDAIIQFGGQRYIVEIKGIKQESYAELTDDIEQACMACETVHKAREQANLYCHMTLIQKAILLIENKNTCDFRLYVIEYEPEHAYPYTNRMNTVKGKVLLVQQHGASKLPYRTCQSIQDPKAQACPMRTVCFSE